MLVTIIWNEITYNTNIKPNIDLIKYQYEKELEHSPCISPDGNYTLKIYAIYDEQHGGSGYILGFIHCKNDNKKEWIYAQKCSIRTILGTDYFRINGGYNFYFPEDTLFYWKNNSNVVIDTHEIDIQNKETYYFNKNRSVPNHS